jgi:hypothetical protein
MSPNISLGTGGWFTIPILAAIFALAVSQNVYVAVSMFVICFVMGLVGFISLIPFVGVILQYIALTWYVNPWLFSMFPIPLNCLWIANIVFWINIVMGFIATGMMTFFVFAYIKDR